MTRARTLVCLLTLTVALSMMLTVKLQAMIDDEATATATATAFVQQASQLYGKPSHPIVVRIEPLAWMPDVDVLAHVTNDGGACVVHVLRSHVANLHTLAHESCHCVREFSNLGPSGYRQRLDVAEYAAAEARANTCAGRIE